MNLIALVLAAGPVTARPPFKTEQRAQAQPQAARPAQAPPAAPLQKKPAAADVQILLDRSGFSPGVIDGKGGSETLARLMLAQDTGTAIVGPARIDLFVGSGAGAGHRAGLIRHPIDFIVLWPR